jgi:hypothetical protein
VGEWVASSAQPQVVELMERHSVSASAHYIEDRLRRRGRSDSQHDEQPSSSGGGAAAGAAGASTLNRQPLFSTASTSAAHATAHAQAFAKEGGRQLRHWKESLLAKLKKVASQPALAVPAGAGMSTQQLGQAAVASAQLLAAGDRSASARQRNPSGGDKAD